MSTSRAKRGSFMERYKARMSFEQTNEDVVELNYGDEADAVVKQEVLQESELDHFEQKDVDAQARDSFEKKDALEYAEDEIVDFETDDEAKIPFDATEAVKEEEIGVSTGTQEDDDFNEVQKTDEDIIEIPECQDDETVPDELSEQNQEELSAKDLNADASLEENILKEEANDENVPTSVDQEQTANENKIPSSNQQKKQYPPVNDEVLRCESTDNGEKDIKRGTVKELINLFSNPDELAKQSHPITNKSYKNEYGVGKLISKVN